MNACLRPKVLEYLAFYKSLKAFLIPLSSWVPLSWHSAIQKMLESSDEHNPDIGVAFIVLRRYTCSLPAFVKDPSYAFVVFC